MSLALVFLALLLPPVSSGAAQDALADRIDTYLGPLYPADEPGAAVLVTRRGETVFRGAFGLASVELQVPMTPEMVFCLASVTKVFTAVGVMTLVENGELSLEDELQDFFPDYRYAGEVTVQNLLMHTSGIPDTGSIPGYMTDHLPLAIEPEDLVALRQDAELEFRPGHHHDYSNTNYALLALIIEEVTGQSWEEYLGEVILEPAGMKRTAYGGHNRIIPGRTTGYAFDGSEWRRARYVSFTRGYGLGGLMSNVDDMGAFHRALLDGEIIRPETLERMGDRYVTDNGRASPYSLGLQRTTVQGHRALGHSGGIFGWRTMFLFLPDPDVCVVVLTNRQKAGEDPTDVAAKIAGLVVAS